MFKCVICLEQHEGIGNNPAPLRQTGRACNLCNELVIAHRFRRMKFTDEMFEHDMEMEKWEAMDG